MPGPSLGEAVISIVASMDDFDKSLQDGLKGAKTTVNKTGNDLGKQLGDTVAKGAESEVGKQAPRVGKAGEKVGKSLGEGIGKAAQAEVGKQAPKIPAAMQRPIQNSIRGMVRTAGQAFGGLGKTATSEFAKIGRVAQQSLAPVGRIAQKAFAPIQAAASKVAAGVSSAFSTVRAGVTRAFTAVGQVAQKAFAPIVKAATAVRNGVVSAFATVRNGVTSALSTVGAVAGKAFAPIQAAAVKVAAGVRAAFDTVKAGVGTALASVGKVAQTAFAGITTAAAKIKAPIQRIMNSSLVKQVGASLSTVGRAAKSAFSALPPIASSAVSKVGSVFGKAPVVVGRVFSKVSGAASSAFGKIQTFAKGAVDKAGVALGKIKTVAGKAMSGVGSVAGKAFSGIANAAKSAVDKAAAIMKTGLKVGIGAAVAGVGVTITKGFSRLTGIENATASLKGLGYQAKQAADIISGPVMEAVSGTAFGLDEAAQAAQGALGAGVKNGTQLADYLTLVGDAASQAQVDFGAMASIMNKVQGAGKLTGDTLQQMADNQLQVMPMLTKALGKPQEAIQKMVSDGKISAKQFQEILQKNIGGAAQKAGETVTGSFKNMGAAMGRLGAKFLGGTFGQLKKIFVGVSGALDGMGDAAQSVGDKIGKALGPVADTIAKFGKTAKENGLSEAFSGLKDASSIFSPIFTIVKAAIPVLAGFGKVFKNLVQDQMASFGKALGSVPVQPFIDGFTAIGTAVTSVFQSFGKVDLGAVFAGIVKAFSNVMGVLPQILPPLLQLISVLADSAGDILPIVAKGIASIGKVLGGALGTTLQTLMPTITSFIKLMSGTLAKILPVVAKLVGVVAQALGGILAEALPPLLDLITDLVQVVGTSLMAILPPLIPIIKLLANALGKILGTSFQAIASTIMSLVQTVLPPLVDLFLQLMPVITQLITTLLPPLVQLFQAFAPVMVPLLNLFSQLVTAILPPLTDLIKLLIPFINVIVEAFAAVVKIVAKVITALVEVATGAKDFKTAFHDAFANIGKIFDPLIKAAQHLWDFLFGHSIFPDMVKAFGTFVTDVGKTLAKIVNKIIKPFKDAAAWISTNFAKAWGKVSGILSKAVSKGGTNVEKILGSVRQKFTDAKNWVTGKFSAGWSKVSGVISGAVNKGKNKVGEILGKGGLRDKFNNAKAWVGGEWKQSWSKVSGWISGAVGKGRDKVGDFLGRHGLRDKFNSAKEWVGTTWKKGWDKAEGWLGGPIKKAKDKISEMLGENKGKGLKGIFKSSVEAYGTIFAKIKEKMKTPVNWVIEHVINKLIDAINKVGKVVGLKGKDGKGVLSHVPKLATGGIFMKHRYTPGRDIGLAALSGGEPVMRPEFGRAVGEDWVNKANAAARVGGVSGAKKFLADTAYGAFASGGIARKPVPPNSDGEYDPRYDPAWLGGFAGGGIARPINAAISRGLHDITTGFPAVDASASVGHPVVAGQAGKVTRSQDLRGNEPRNATQNGFYSYGRVIEIAHKLGQKTLYAHLNARMARVGDYVKAGQQIGISGNTGHSTGPHLHFGSRGLPPGSYWNSIFGKVINSISGVVSGASNLFDSLPNPSDMINNAVKKAIDKFPYAGKWAELAIQVPKYLAEKAIDWGKKKVDAIGSAVGGAFDFAKDTAVKGSAQAVIHAMMLKKWPNSEWPALKQLVSNESGWNPAAVNQSSGAYGLFQALPANKIDKYGARTSIRAQGNFGLNYISDRYGTPSEALRQWMARSPHWYDNGGWLPPGVSTVINGTGKKEPAAVFTADQWQVLHDLASRRTEYGTTLRPGDRVVFEIEGKPMTAIAKKVLADETKRALVRS